MPEENILPFGDVSFLKRKALANRNIQPDLSYLYAYSTKFDEFGKNDAFVTRETDQAENRAINQSFVDKVGNAAVQGLTTAGTSFVGGTVGVANGLIDVVSGKNFLDNSTFKILQEIDEASKEAFPLYKTKAEQQGSFTDQVLSDDFFLDTLFNGLGFIAGGWGSGSLIGGVLGKGLRYAKLGQNSKVAEIAAQAGIENPELFGTSLGKLAQKLPNMTAATSGRIYESALEANQVYDSLQEKIQNGELTEAEAKQIRNSVFGVNMLLALPDYYQYTKFLDNFSNKRATLNAIKNVEGKFVQDKLTGKSAALTNLGQLGFQTGTEALEEGFQFVASKAGEEGNVNYGEAFADAALQSLSDPQFYASMVAGGLVGGVMGGVGTVVGESESTKRNKFTEQVVDLMNKHLPIEYTDKLNKAQTKFNNFYDLEQQKNKVLDAIEVEQDPAKVAVLKDAYRVLDHEQLTNFVQAASESGTYEERLEELELLTKESDENLKNLANIRANKVVDGREINPQQVLRERIQKVKEFKKTYDTVAETYPNIELNELNNKFKAQSLFEFADKKENLVDKEIQKEEARIFNSAGDNPVAKDRLEQLKTEKEYYAGLKKQAVIDFNTSVQPAKSVKTKPAKTTKSTFTPNEITLLNGVLSEQEPSTETSDEGIDRGDEQQGDTTIVDTEAAETEQKITPIVGEIIVTNAGDEYEITNVSADGKINFTKPKNKNIKGSFTLDEFNQKVKAGVFKYKAKPTTAGVFTPTPKFGTPKGPQLTTASTPTSTPAPVVETSREQANDFNIGKGVILYDNNNPKGLTIKAFSTGNKGTKQYLKGILFIDNESKKEFWWNNNSKWNWKDMFIQKNISKINNAELATLETPPVAKAPVSNVEKIEELKNQIKGLEQQQAKDIKESKFIGTNNIIARYAPQIKALEEELKKLGYNTIGNASTSSLEDIEYTTSFIISNPEENEITEKTIDKVYAAFKKHGIEVSRAAAKVFTLLKKDLDNQFKKSKLKKQEYITLDRLKNIDAFQEMLNDSTGLVLLQRAINMYNANYGLQPPVIASVINAENYIASKIDSATDIDDENKLAEDLVSSQLLSGLAISYKAVETSTTDNRKTLFIGGDVQFTNNPQYDELHTNNILQGDEIEIVKTADIANKYDDSDSNLDTMELSIRYKDKKTGQIKSIGFLHRIDYIKEDNIALDKNLQEEQDKIRKIRKYFINNTAPLKAKITEVTPAKLEFNKKEKTVGIAKDMLKNVYIFINNNFTNADGNFKGELIELEEAGAISGRVYLLAPQATHQKDTDTVHIRTGVKLGNFKPSTSPAANKTITEIRENIVSELTNYLTNGVELRNGWADRFLLLTNKDEEILSKFKLKYGKVNGVNSLRTASKIITDPTRVEELLDELSFNLNLKALKDKNPLPNSTKNYEDLVIEGELIKTNLATKQTQFGRLYAFQPSFYFEIQNTEDFEMQVKQEETPETNVQKALDNEQIVNFNNESDFIKLPFDDEEFSVFPTLTEEEELQVTFSESLLINPNLTFEEELSVVDSVAQLIIQKGNNDEVITSEILAAVERIKQDKYSPEKQVKVDALVNNLLILVEKYQDYKVKAEELLKNLNFIKNDKGEYETFADYNDSIEQYIEDSSAKENRLDSMYDEIRRMLSFIPEYTDKGKEKRNSLGMLSFVPIDFVFTQIVEELSSEVYTNTMESYAAMVKKLRESKSYYLNRVAKILDESPNKQLKRQFYQVFSAEKENPVTLVASFREGAYSVYENAADNSTGFYLIKGEVAQEMYNKPGLSTRDINGKNVINKNYIKVIKERVTDLLKDQDKVFFKTVDKQTILTEEGEKELISILNSLGIRINTTAIRHYLQKREAVKFKGVRRDNTYLQGEILDILIKSLESSSTKTLQDFLGNEGAIMERLAKSILLTSNRAIGGTYRVAGDQYSNFTNSKPITEKLNWLKANLNNLKQLPVYQTIADRLEKIVSNIVVTVDRGFRIQKKGSIPKFYKNTNTIEFEVIRMLESQLIDQTNKSIGLIKSETLSDKSTNLMFKNILSDIKAEDILKSTTDFTVSNKVINSLYKYFEYELAKIQKYKTRIEIDATSKLKVGDSTKDIKGTGEYFYYYEFLNAEILEENGEKELLNALYKKENGVYRIKDSVVLTEDIEKLIKDKIEQRFNDILEETKSNWIKADILKQNKNGLELSIIDNNYHNYLKRVYSIERPNDKPIAIKNQKEAILQHALVDFVQKYMTGLLETNILFTDPAQQSKVKVSKEPLSAKTLLNGLLATFDNIGKRYARIVAQGRRGAWNTPKYNILIANDMNIDASFIEQYPEEVKDAYKDLKNEKLTDAQEVTTVWEHLNDRFSQGEIDFNDVVKGTMHYDPVHYQLMLQDPNSELNKFFGTPTPDGKLEALPLQKLSKEEIQELDSKALLQPRKPVQVVSELSNGLIQDYYIKTSSIPLLPSAIKDSPMQKVWEKMINSKVSRIVFVSGVKIGSTNPVNLFDKDSNITVEAAAAFNTPVELNRSGYHIQLNVPYDEGKNTIRQVTQAMKLLFVDLPNTLKLSSGRTVGEAKERFITIQNKLVEKSKKELISKLFEKENILPDKNGNYVITNVEKLANLLRDEADKRNFTENAKKMLQTDGKGNFIFPLVFNPSVGKIQPILQALVTNALTRIKIPGKSYVQASEILTYKSFGKGGNIKAAEDLTEEETNSITYTSPKNKKGKLNFIKKGEEKDGVKTKSDKAQVYVPFYFTHKGKKLKIADFIKDGYIDLEKLPEELLTSIGFRIPTEGRKSMMIFEVAGFLPESMGDTIVVPSEIAIQMGSDYDVDKLYLYHYETDLAIEPPSKEELALVSKNLSQKLELADLLNKPQVAELQNYINKLYNELFPKGAEELSITNPERALEISEELEILEEYEENLFNVEEEIKELRKSRKRFLVKRKSDANELIDIYEEVISSFDVFDSVVIPQGFKDLANSIEIFDETYGTKKSWLGSYNPNYQRDLFFDNAAGKTGVGIGANTNTFHALAQDANMFIKKIGILFKQDNGEYYSETVTDNRVNEYKEGMYPESQLESKSAWRLDKIFGFDGGVISERITEWLAASVDNAKEKLLGRGGINNYNLGVSLTIIQAGFNHDWVLSFINQPILKEYYEMMDSLKSIFDKSFDIDKKEKKILELCLKYADGNKEIERAINKDGFTLSEYKEMLGQTFDTLKPEERLYQIAILKAFLDYDAITTSLTNIQQSMVLDSKGLPKNYVETIQLKNRQTDAINGSIGNVDKMSKTSVGPYSKATDFAISLYSRVYDYIKPAYSTIVDNIASNMFKTNELTEDNINDIYNGLFSYVYSHPVIQQKIAGVKSIESYKADLQSNIVKDFLALKEKYPNNNLLRRITISQNGNLTMGNTFLKQEKLDTIITLSWLDMMNVNQKDPEIKKFALDLAAYAMYFNNDLYGVSNFFKYIPFEYFKALNLNSILKDINTNLNNETYFKHFEKQFFQHNPTKAKSITSTIKDVMKKNPGYVPGSYLPIQLDKELAPRLAIEKDNKGNVIKYAKYIYFFDSVNQKPRLYERTAITDKELQFYEIDLLGLDSDTIREYEFGISNKRSSITENRIAQTPVVIPAAQATSTPQPVRPIIDKLFKGVNDEELTDPNDVLANLTLSAVPSYVALAKFITGRVNNYKIVYGKLKGNNIASHNGTEKTITVDLNKLKALQTYILNQEKLKGKSKDEAEAKVNATIERHILHEFYHAVTANKLKDPEFQKTPEYIRLEEIYNIYLSKFSEKEKANLELFKKYLAKEIDSLPEDITIDNYNIYYAATSILEFAVEAPTSGIVARKLAASEGIRKNIINEILDIIKKALRITKGSLLDDAIEAIFDVVTYGEPSVSDIVTETSTKVITDVEKLAKLNKGRTVKIKYYKYKNSFDAIVTGKVQMVLGPTISINDITKEEKIIAPAVYQIEFKTNTGKLITADESDVTGLINTETGSESTEKSIEPSIFDLNMVVPEFMRTLTKDQREIFRKLKEEGIFKTECE